MLPDLLVTIPLGDVLKGVNSLTFFLWNVPLSEEKNAENFTTRRPDLKILEVAEQNKNEVKKLGQRGFLLS
jgi:hypothetical protein